MLRALYLAVLLFALNGCGGGVALMVLEGLASGATIADKVVGIDVSLTQNQPNKVPVAAILAPIIAPPPPDVLLPSPPSQDARP
jgi:hypothetical protein